MPFFHQFVNKAGRVAVSVNHPNADVSKREGTAFLATQDSQDVELLGGHIVRLEQRPVPTVQRTRGVHHSQHQLLLWRGEL